MVFAASVLQAHYLFERMSDIENSILNQAKGSARAPPFLFGGFVQHAGDIPRIKDPGLILPPSRWEQVFDAQFLDVGGAGVGVRLSACHTMVGSIAVVGHHRLAPSIPLEGEGGWDSPVLPSSAPSERLPAKAGPDRTPRDSLARPFGLGGEGLDHRPAHGEYAGAIMTGLVAALGGGYGLGIEIFKHHHIRAVRKCACNLVRLVTAPAPWNFWIRCLASRSPPDFDALSHLRCVP